MNRKVDFFIVGAPKAGTTALYSILNKHPQVCMSSEKETNYFSFKEIEEQKLYYVKTNINNESDYRLLFKCEEQAIVLGEASVSYLYYSEVPKRIKTYNPDAKIIISLRDPVKRAFSHYQMDFSLGLVDTTFHQIFLNGPTHPKTGNYYQQYFLLSNYADQIERYIQQFPISNICILLHENLIQCPEQSLEKVFNFLGIEKIIDPNKFEKQNVSGAGKNILIQKLYQNKYLRKTSSFLFGNTLKNIIKSSLLSKDNLPTLDTTFAIELQHYFQPQLLKLKNQTGLKIDHWMIESSHR